MAVRMEKDTFGPIEVPADRLWGAQTQRSLQNFKIAGDRMPRRVIHALTLVKRACAQVLTSITLPPHGVTVREITVTSGAQAFDLVALPPGDYAFYARVESVEYTLESERVALQVL